MGRFIGATMTVLLVLAVMRGAWAETSPTEYCRQIGTDDTLRFVPPSLVSAVVRLFQLEAMPPVQVERSTYFRCADGHVFVCTVGANLACGKGDTRRDFPGVKAWCVEHAGSQNVPAYVTGHATIYLWRCDGPRPVASRSALSVDQRGFISQNWTTPVRQNHMQNHAFISRHRLLNRTVVKTHDFESMCAIG